MTTTEPVLISVQGRGRVNLGQLATHNRYLVHREPDGTLIWVPAEVISATERKLLADDELMASIKASRADRSRFVRRDRSNSPRF